MTAGQKTSRDDKLSLEMTLQKAVRFNPITTYHVYSDGDLTQDEIDQVWWNREELSEIKLCCRGIASKSRLLRSVTEVIISDLYQETHNSTQSGLDGVELETCLLVSRSARRFVRNYSTVGSQRGLERWISDELRQRNRRTEKNRARICRLQRVPGMSEDVIAQITQTFSRFDRIIARLLAQADELANTRRALDPRRLQISAIGAEDAKLPLSPRRNQVQSHPTVNGDQKLGKESCQGGLLIHHMVHPLIISAGSSSSTFQ